MVTFITEANSWGEITKAYGFDQTNVTSKMEYQIAT